MGWKEWPVWFKGALILSLIIVIVGFRYTYNCNVKSVGDPNVDLCVVFVGFAFVIAIIVLFVSYVILKLTNKRKS